MNTKRRNGSPPKRLELTPVLVEEGEDPARRAQRLASGLDDPREEVAQPTLPIATGADALQVVVVIRAVRLEVEAEVQDRLVEGAVGAE